MKVFFMPQGKIDHKINKLTGFNAPVVKIENFDTGFYNLSLVLNERNAWALELLMIYEQRGTNGSFELPSNQYISKSYTTNSLSPEGKKRLFKKV